MYSVSAQRLAAAVLDALDQPLDPAAVDAYLASLTSARIPFRPQDTRKWTKSYVRQTDDGELTLDRSELRRELGENHGANRITDAIPRERALVP